jgi:hypothetical protein
VKREKNSRITFHASGIIAMAVRTNLAKNPYGNRRLWVVALSAIIVISFVLTVGFKEKLNVSGQQRQAMLGEVKRQETLMAALRARIPPPVTPDQLKPQERDLLTAASVLIERRAFRWSRLLEDIERHVGNDVRVTSISVALDEASRIDALRPGKAPVEVSMIIVGRQLQNVTDAERSLLATGRFTHFRYRKQAALEGTQEVEFEIDVTYNP